MRVAVNRYAAAGPKTGIGHYTMELLRCLQEQAGPDEIDPCPHDWMCSLRQFLVRHTITPVPPPSNPTARVPRRPARQAVAALLRPCNQALLRMYFRFFCNHSRYDLYHEPNFIPLPADVPTVATLHDLSVILHPEWHPPGRVAHFERNFARGLRQCVHFFAISEAARQEIIQTLGIAPDRITCTYMGIRPGMKPLPAAAVEPVLHRLGLPPNYLLCLGTIEPRKNILRLLQAYCDLPGALRERAPLVLAGGWGWRTEEVADFFHAEARHRNVMQLGYLDEAYLPALYNGARALVFPSLYEGFGLPPIEMMACGGAVLASTAGSVVETAGRHAHLIAPEDVEGWRDAMARVVTDDAWRQTLRIGVQEAARPYTWDRCAADTLRIYRRIGGITTPEVRPLARAA